VIVLPEPAEAPVMLPVIVPTVQVNVLAALAVNAMFVAVALHITAVLAVVTIGVGLTVTVIVYAGPGQAGVVVDVGVTIYCTVPAVELLGLVNVWAIVLPDPALAPVMPPVIVPIVHVNVLADDAVNAMFVAVALQITAVLAVVTTGVGFTVTVIVYAGPGHAGVAVDVGVTIYWTVPAAVLLGLTNTSLIVLPDPPLAPVMPPVIVPTVQVNVLAALAVRAILGLVLLQVENVLAVVTTGLGLTVTVIVYAGPGHAGVAVEVGVTIYWTVPAALLLGLVNVCAIVGPLPTDAPVIPPVIVPTVHVNVLAALAVNAMLVAVALQIVAVLAVVTTGVGLTVTVIVYAGPGQAGVAVEVGVTIYWTVPEVELLGLFSVWAIVLPEPALAPVMLPVIVPTVHANVLADDAVNAMFVAVPLHITAVLAVVTTGVGFTVTVIVYAGPGQAGVVVDVGVTIYWTVPAALLLGLTNTSLIVLPDPALAPVMPPVIVPTVQVNVLAALAVRAILGLVLLQVENALAVVTTGLGLTVTVIVYAVPGQAGVAVDVGVTIYCTVPAALLLGLLKVCAIVFPEPALAPVILPVIVPTVHVNVLAALAVNAMFVAVAWQIVAVLAVVTTGLGLTVTVIV
jgi:hypothetical protein